MCFEHYYIRFAHTFCGLVHSVLPLQHEIRILQATTECCGNLATSYICVGLASTKHRQRNDASQFGSPLAANFASQVGTCEGIVESFKPLSAIAHPQFLALEL